MSDRKINRHDSFLKENIDYINVKDKEYSTDSTTPFQDEVDSEFSVVSFETNKIAKQDNLSKNDKLKQNKKKEKNEEKKTLPKSLPPTNINKPPNNHERKMNDLLSNAPSLIWDLVPISIFLIIIMIIGFFTYELNSIKLKDIDYYYDIFINNLHVFSIAISIGVFFFSMISTSTRIFYILTVLIFNFIISKQLVNLFLYKIGLSNNIILIITNLFFLVINIFLFQYPYNYLVKKTFQENITSIYFKSLISRIFIPILSCYSLIIFILTFISIFFGKDVNKFLKFLKITILCLFLNFLHTIMLGYNISIIGKKSRFLLIKLIPTLFKYSLLRPIYFLISLLRKREINEEKTSFSNSLKYLLNIITRPIQPFIKGYSSTLLYFSMVFSVYYSVSCNFALKTTSKYIETDLYINNIKNVPFLRIFFPIFYSTSYILIFLLPITYKLSILPLIFLSSLLPDIVVTPFYFAVMKAYKELKTNAIKLKNESIDKV